MILPRVRFTIGRLMIVVAVAGVLTALLRVPTTAALMAVAVFILGPPSIACFCPFFARPGRRLLAATWVAALWPLSIPLTENGAWGIAYGFLGHSPGQADNDSVLGLLISSVWISILLSLFSPVVCLLLPLYVTEEPISKRGPWDTRAIPIFLIPLVWILSTMASRWDPLGASVWFMD
jgi:hypothetical protein